MAHVHRVREVALTLAALEGLTPSATVPNAVEPSTRSISGRLGTIRLVARSKGREVGHLQSITGGVTIGSSKDCHLVLEDGTMSRKHAEQPVRAGDPLMKDHTSRHGPHLAGARLQAAFGATLVLREVETPSGKKVTAREVGIDRVSLRKPINKHGIDVSAL